MVPKIKSIWLLYGTQNKKYMAIIWAIWAILLGTLEVQEDQKRLPRASGARPGLEAKSAGGPTVDGRNPA